MKKKVAGTLILLSFSLLGAEKLTLNEALSIAYENNYEYQNAKLEKKNADLQVKEGYKNVAPKLDYTGSYAVLGNDRNFMLNDGSFSEDRFTHELGIVQPIYNGGTIVTGVKIANMAQELIDYKLIQSKSNLKLGVINSYLQVIAQNEAIKVYKNSLEEVKIAYDQAERKYELDLISKSDFLPLKSKLISTETSLIEAKNQADIYMIRLKNLIGLSAHEEIELEKLEVQKYDLELINLEEDIKFALANSKESRISELNTEIVEAQEKISRADLLPRVNGKLAYSSNSGEVRDSMDEWYWTAGVEVSWRIFDFGQSLNSYSRSKNETKKAENLEKKSKEDLEVMIRTNYIDLVKLNGMVEAKEAELEASEENYELQKRKYNEGIISITDYLIYETSINDTRLSLIKTRLDYYYAYEKYNENLK